MKITVIEEIESKRAWAASMFCPRCGESRYQIHHQLQPNSFHCWWLSCPNCEYETEAMFAKDLAKKRWKEA